VTARAAVIALALIACGRPAARHPEPGHGGHHGGGAVGKVVVGTILHGYATWYGGNLDGGPTASGERFRKRDLTAAHRSLPFGTLIKVTTDHTHRSVTVRINDRGPYGRDRSRILDISEAAAQRIGIIDAGVAAVTIEVLSLPRR
jgi:rare lipoprotein A